MQTLIAVNEIAVEPAADVADLQAAQAGEVAGFQRLFDRHHVYLYRFCLSMLRDESDAEDAVQESFFRAYRAIKSCKSGNAFRSWLTSIAANYCKDQLRSRKRRQKWLENAAQEPVAAVQQTADPEAQLAYLQASEHILAVLSADQRAALTMYSGLGQSYDEIAATMGISLASVKSLLWRARAKLQKSFPQFPE